MRALLTLATLKPTEDRLTGYRCAGADELDVKGRPRNRPFLARVVQVRVCERGTMVRTTSSSGNTSTADSRSVLTNTGEYSFPEDSSCSGTSSEARALPERSEGKDVEDLA